MTDVERLIREIADEAERTKDDPYPEGSVGVRRLRGEVLSVRLNPEEHAQLVKSAAEADLPPSTFARSQILAMQSTPGNLRLQLGEEAADVLSDAADAVGLDVSSFVVAAALERAHAILADRQFSQLTPQQIRQIKKTLDAHPEIIPQLREMLQRNGTHD